MRLLEDNYRHKGLRQKLVQTLRKKGITNEDILRAIGKIPRHQFLDLAFEEWAYRDTAFPIAAEQTISQPYTVAFQTSLLDLKPKDKVLEIGTGSGYQACVLSELGVKVYSIERQRKLFDNTNRLLQKMGYNKIRTLYGDGYQGSVRFAPFDKILVTAAAPKTPPALLEQLKIGGYLVIPVGGDDVQKMKRIKKVSPQQFEQETFGDFSFVPMLSGINSHRIDNPK